MSLSHLRADPLLVVGLTLTLRLRLDRFNGFVRQAFPTVSIEYVDRFSVAPIDIVSPYWHNDPRDVEEFARYLRLRFPIKESPFGVIIMERLRGPNGCSDNLPFVSKTGADRRAIVAGFNELVEAVKAVRGDTLAVAFENLDFADQLSATMAADTLIGQHGAGFAHAHWMPPFGHLIELQCTGRPDCPGFVRSIARICRQRHSVVTYPCCRVLRGATNMTVTAPMLVANLLTPRVNRQSLETVIE